MGRIFDRFVELDRKSESESVHGDLSIPWLRSFLGGTCPNPAGKMFDGYSCFDFVAVLSSGSAGARESPRALLLEFLDGKLARVHRGRSAGV